MHLLGIVCILYVIYQLIKEACTPTLTAEHWANKELEHRDRMNGMSEKEILKNAQRGRYYVSKEVMQAYPVPHREADGKHRVIIENCDLHRDDINKYGAYQASKWVDQGKYNLTEDELKITHLQFEKRSLRMGINLQKVDVDKRIKEIDEGIATSGFDYKNTVALRQWKKARANDPRNINTTN